MNMPNHSFWENARRVVKDQKPNVYSDVSREVADEMKLDANPVTRGVNDSRDAFRHAYTSSVFEERYGDAIATLAGNINEWKNHLPSGKVRPEEEWMDYYNNEKGREIAARVKAAGGNEEDLKQEVAKAVANNELAVTPFDPRRTYEEHGDFDRAVKESEQQMEASWNRDLAEIVENPEISPADKQQARRDLGLRYQEYERQLHQVIEKERAKLSR
jgi:hypothetical protein